MAIGSPTGDWDSGTCSCWYDMTTEIEWASVQFSGGCMAIPTPTRVLSPGFSTTRPELPFSCRIASENIAIKLSRSTHFHLPHSLHKLHLRPLNAKRNLNLCAMAAGYVILTFLFGCRENLPFISRQPSWFQVFLVWIYGVGGFFILSKLVLLSLCCEGCKKFFHHPLLPLHPHLLCLMELQG